MAEFRQKQDTFKDRMNEALDAVKEQIVEDSTEVEEKTDE